MCMSIVYLPDLQPLFLPLNQWVQGSSPWEDTKGYPKGYPFLFTHMDEIFCVFICESFLL